LNAAQAAVLEQKWVAGQQLSYDLKLSDATIVLQSDAAAPFLWAGVPWEIALDGTGEVALDTRAVDADGAGTVAVRVPRLLMNGSMMGMFKAALDVQNGQAKLLVNNKPFSAKPTDVSVLINPTTSLQISRYGRVLNFVPLQPADAAGPDTKAAPNAKTPKATPSGGAPLDVVTMLHGTLLNALPQLWPGRDIAVGEKWSIQPKVPLPAKPASGATAPATPQMLTLGTIDMTLQAEEEVEGRAVQRVAVQGTMSLDAAAAASLMSRDAKQDAKQRLTSMKQTVNGDIWFDAAAGQIVKVLLKLNMQSAGAGTAPAKDAASKPRPWKSFQNFDGTVQMQLRKISYSSATS
jgi:hypothetical protein